MWISRVLFTPCIVLAIGVVASAEEPPVFLLKWGSYGSGDGQFASPIGVATDAAGNVYVAESYNNRVQKFGPGTVQVDATTWGRVKAERR